MEGDQNLKLASFQSLECPVCLSTFNEPKLLFCGHTFCKACLDPLVKSRGDEQKIRCPICRVDTMVPGRDVSRLQTNLAVKSLVEDVKSQYQLCTDCEADEKLEAVVYCQDCGKYLCITCQAKHSQWDSWSDHEVLNVKEIASGKASVKKYRKCRKHPREDEVCFCSDCRKFACFRCIIKDHAHERHLIMEASTYVSDHREKVQKLKSKAEDKHTRIRKYMDCIDEQRGSLQDVKKQCMDDISKAFEESVLQLREQKESLLQEVVRKNGDADAALGRLMETAQQQMAQVTTMTDLVANEKKIPLETEALAAHDLLCRGLQEALEQEDPDYKELSTSSKQGKCIAFERNKGKEESGKAKHPFTLGKIVNSVAKNIALPIKNSMNCMVPTPDGRMAVGCHGGGIEIFAANGQLQQTVLKDVRIRQVGFLSDGRPVVRDTENNINLYSTEWKKLDVRFETSNEPVFLYGGLVVDANDLIYVGYTKAKKIQVFSPAGGKATREIICNGCKPWQILSYHQFLIIGSASRQIQMIDKDGNVRHVLTKSDMRLHATTTSHNDMILIATVNSNKDSVSIDQYNNKLQHVKSIISNYKIEQPQRALFSLKEFRSGEMAFCSPDRLYIFH